MICSRCQSENSANAAFCDQCGAQLEIACFHCGEANRRGALFCRYCGQAIGPAPVSPPVGAAPAPITYVPKHLSEKILASRQRLDNERKHVTVLFADIRGSTTLIEGRDPEDAQKIIDPVLYLMMKAVHRYEGTVNQVLGDGIMALFGAPLAHEDHALRACYAALAMQEELQGHRRNLGQSEETGLQIGIGMNSGDVVLRSIDNDLNVDYSALGHATHLAARMQELAQGGAIIMTAATVREVEGFVQIKPLGAVQVKGVSRPVETFKLIGATTARTRVQAAGGRDLTPLVGRETEIETFKNRVKQAATGHGQILAMVGEPGMGKSRLVHEFTRHQLPPGWLVLEGASVSYGKATAYFPLIDMLRRYFQIGDEDSAVTIGERVSTQVLELDNGLRDAIAPLLSLLGALPDDKELALQPRQNGLSESSDIAMALHRFHTMDPQQRRRHTLDALKQLLVRESSRQPVLAVFEDLHWIDSETQAFLDGLIESLPGARLLLLINYRPGYSHAWSNRTYYTQMRVDPLPQTGAAELLRHLLGANKDLIPLREMLLLRTEGNPFFAEESVRSLVETGFLVGEKGAYRPGLKIDAIRIPSTVQNLLADRIDRLPVQEKQLLQTAAVIGVIVPVRLLRAVSALPEGDLETYLTHLQAGEFLYESNLFPELEYTFKHALTNEVAYGALLQSRRIELHKQVVRALESLTRPASYDQVEKLAHHAYAGALWEPAVGYLKEAGDAAISRSSFRNAVLYFERALEALRHIPETPTNITRGIDLRFDIRNTLFLLNDFKRGFEYLEEAKEAATKINDQERLGKLFTWMTAYWNLDGNSEQAVSTGKQALEHAIGAKAADYRVVAHYFLGVAYHNLGQFDLSIVELNKALALISEDRKYELFGTTGIVSVVCKGWLIRGLAQCGNFSEAIASGDEAMRTAEQCDHPFSMIYAYYAVGVVALIRGEFDRAIMVLERALKVCETVEIPVQRPLVISCLAAAYAYTGRCEKASELLENAADRRAWMAGTGVRQLPFGKAMRLVWEVEACLWTERYDEAEALARRVLEVSVESKDRGSEAWLRLLIGALLRRHERRDWREAESSYRAALVLARELGMLPVQAHCHLGLGRCLVLAKRQSLAIPEVGQASDLYRAMGMRFWIARAESVLAAIG